MTWREGLFFKYFLFITLLVGGSLIASGAINLYFSYQQTRASVVKLQREKALTAAVRIEQFARDIEIQLRWTTLPVVRAGAGQAEERRLDFHRLLRLVPAITEVSHLAQIRTTAPCREPAELKRSRTVSLVKLSPSRS